MEDAPPAISPGSAQAEPTGSYNNPAAQNLKLRKTGEIPYQNPV